MFKDIWGLFAAGGVAGLFAGLLLVATVRHIFRHYWFSWGLMESSDTLPVTHDVHTRWLDASLLASCALCGAVITASVPWASPSSPELLWSRSVFCALLVMQARIDAQTGMLPDRLTLGMLWLGLLFSLNGGWVSLEHSVSGAVAGYIVMWLLVAIFRFLTGREAMGCGDFKLSAAIGAWLGSWSLLGVWLVASIWLCIAAMFDHLRGRQHFREPRPFGPGLALGGILVMLLGLTLTE
jgi:prepilin signal peptidase PulO-like enzyme (type II secretory pathway)